MSENEVFGLGDEARATAALPLLPPCWSWATLEQLAAPEKNAITDGPFGSNLKTEHYTDSGPRVIRLQNIGDMVFKDARAFISEERYASLQKHRVHEGDLVLATLGDTLPRACVIPKWLGRAIVKADCVRFRPNNAAAVAGYLNYAVNFEETRRRTSSIIHGVGRPRLNLKEIKNILVPVAPLNEQRRIVEEVDELFSDLDAGVAALERVQRRLAHYRAAVLKVAVEGALTAEWRRQHPATEPASALLTRILAERRRRWEEEQLRKFAAAGKEPTKNWKADYKEPVAPDMADPPPFPEGWALASMDALTCRITSGSRDWQQYYGRGSATFVMAQNVRPGHLDLTRRQAVNPPPEDPSCERSRVECGDLLVTIVGVNTGDVCRVPDSLPEHYVCQSVALMRPAEAATAKFLSVYYNSPSGGLLHYRRYIYGAGRPHLSFDQLKMTPVLLPPLDEQEAIVEAVEDQLSVVDHIEADLETKLQAAQALRQSILRHAFTGQLVPQDPDDEPASELLKRIAAEREERARQAATAKRDGAKANARRRTRRTPRYGAQKTGSYSG